MKLLKSIFNHEYKELKKFGKIADAIESLEPTIEKLTDSELKNKTPEFKERLAKGETLDDILPEAYAVAREVARRKLGERAFYVQLLGAIAIHHGNIAELKTGEGKTLVTIFPAYLNSLEGKGVHVITVNEYLSSRNAEWMGPIYEGLGVSVGVNLRELSPQEKRDAYDCDITYSTNNEVGFDYLRDNMVIKSSERVARPFNFAIIDEVDSILIDEARTPLIISGGFMKSANLYIQTDKFVRGLKVNDGYKYDEQTKAVMLDQVGIEKGEAAFNLENLYDIENANLVHFINQALKANFAMKRDVDYVVEDDKVVIVDQFTGRLMHGRTFSDGLHQALEAKEGVTINEETKTLATITFQNLFRMYKKLSGMTGTAKTEEEEFRDIYNMYVISIPTNKPVMRKDWGDLLFATQDGKFNAIVKEIKERHEKGQPLLVGTVAVETSELLSEKLKKAKIPHEVLNAKNHAREAEIIAKAGEKGSVTIATNMAGRGTDIKINDEVRELGGLCVIGTERHESRRIDNQLRGRSGRQGDPGFSQFCVSFEDELMVRFGSDKAKNLLARVGFSGDAAIRNKMLSNSLESAQKRVEGNNFDVRKTLLEYDNVINEQREVIYEKRNEILDFESIHESVLSSFRNFVEDNFYEHTKDGNLSGEDREGIASFFSEMIGKKIKPTELEDLAEGDAIEYIYTKLVDNYENKIKDVPPEIVDEFEKAITLRVIDTYWMEHINTMSHLREGIHLRGYAQENPLRAYKGEGYELFDSLLSNIDKQASTFLLKAEIRQNVERKKVAEGVANTDSSKVKKAQPKRVAKVGRNDKCPCGSEKKYKQCCGK